HLHPGAAPPALARRTGAGAAEGFLEPMKRIRLVLAAVIVAGALLYLIVGGIRGAIVYYTTPSELLAQGPSAVGRTMRLGGQVMPGSRRWNGGTLELRFTLGDGNAGAGHPPRGAAGPVHRGSGGG